MGIWTEIAMYMLIAFGISIAIIVLRKITKS